MKIEGRLRLSRDKEVSPFPLFFIKRDTLTCALIYTSGGNYDHDHLFRFSIDMFFQYKLIAVLFSHVLFSVAVILHKTILRMWINRLL